MTTASPAERPHPCIIGLTGGIGSGKSTVTRLFAELGINIVDTDLIAHALTAADGAAMPAIVKHFGNSIQRSDGALDRATMRSLIFATPACKTELESILHPMIREASHAALRQCTSAYALLVVPLLLETGHYLPICRRILVIDCTPEEQIQRVMTRSQLRREEVLRIMASQVDRDTRTKAADDILNNSGSPAELPGRVKTLHEAYLQLAAKLKQNP